MNLRPLPSDGRFYCGPSAIAAFTGLHPKVEVRTAINKVRGRKATQGVVLMQPGEIKAVLELFGFQIRRVPTPDKPTLKEFVKAHPDAVFVAYVTGHFVAVSRGMCLDNKTMIARPIDSFPGNRKLVKEAIMLTNQ
jgi:hypothetical protein